MHADCFKSANCVLQTFQLYIQPATYTYAYVAIRMKHITMSCVATYVAIHVYAQL